MRIKQNSSIFVYKGCVFIAVIKKVRGSASGTKDFVEVRTFGQANVHKTKSVS